MELTENLDLKTYRKVFETARDYGGKSVQCDFIKKLWKKQDCVIVKRVNTPEKIPAIYVYVKTPSEKKKNSFKYSWFTFVELKGEEGSSFLCSTGKFDRPVIVKSHVISRYIERHGWSKSRESCENYFLMKSVLLQQDIDKYTNEINMAFDNGMLLGYLREDGMQVINTYISMDIMHSNQKIKARYQELKLKEAKRNADLWYNPLFKCIIDKLDSLDYENERFRN